MNSKYITEKNRIYNRIRELERYNEIDNNAIERLRTSQINIEFNKKRIEKLYEKNEERKYLIEELKQREKDLENGKLDSELNEQYQQSQIEINKKQQESIRKKEELLNNKREDKKKSDIRWKDTANEDKMYKYAIKDIDRSEKNFFRICDSIPEYILRNLKEMPNNKGYIWKGIYCYGELPAETNYDTVIMFEKFQNGILHIHEISETEIKIYEKQGKNKKILISQKPRRCIFNSRSILNWIK